MAQISSTWLVRIGLAVILLCPLYFSAFTIFPFVVLKATLVHLGIGLIALAAVWTSYQSSKPLPLNSLTLALLGFLITSLIAGYQGANFEQSFFSTFERSQGLYGLVFCIGLSLSLATINGPKDLWRSTFRSIVVAGFIVSVPALAYFVGLYEVPYLYRDFGRLAFTAGNAAVFGSYLAILTSLAFALCLVDYQKVSRRMSILQFGMLTLLLFSLLATGARGGLLAFLFSAVVILYASSIPRKWKLIATAMGFVILTVGSFAMRDIIENRLTQSTLGNQSISYRLDAWQIGWQALIEKPWLGWGQENFISIFGQFSTPNQIANETFDTAHNHMVAIGVASGFVGLVSYLSVIGIALFLLWRGLHSSNQSTSDNSLLSLSVFLSYQIASLFLFENIISQPLFYISLAYCLYLAKPIRHLPSKFRPALAATAILAMIISSVYEVKVYQSATRIRTVEAVPEWSRKLVAANAESGGIRQEELLYLFAMETWGDWRNLNKQEQAAVKQTLETLIGDSNIVSLNWRTTFNIANAYLLMVNDYPDLLNELELLVQRTLQLAPERPQSHRLLANYFLVTNQQNEARQVLESYLKKNPQRPRMLEILERLNADAAD
jgi:O-antigen ligase